LDSSTVIAAQQWLATDYENGPITRVVFIDVTSWKIAVLKRKNKGFVGDFRFDGDSFTYRTVFIDRFQTVDSRVSLSSIWNWIELKSAKPGD